MRRGESEGKGLRDGDSVALPQAEGEVEREGEGEGEGLQVGGAATRPGEGQ